MCSTSPARTPKLQLAAKQLLTGECWIAPKRYPMSKAKEKLQQDGRRGRITFRIKPHIHQRCPEGPNKPCAHQDPETPETEPELCLSVPCRGTGQQRPAAGAGALGTADLGMA